MAEELRNEAQRSNGGGRIVVGVDLEEKKAGGVDESVGWEGFFVEVKGPRRGREGCGMREERRGLYRGGWNGERRNLGNSTNGGKATRESHTRCSDEEWSALQSGSSQRNSPISI